MDTNHSVDHEGEWGVEKELKQYARRQWWEQNKHKVIAYIIMGGMLIGWLIYVIVMTSKGYVLMFN